LAEELTDKFENPHKVEDWEELDYFETIEAFVNAELYPQK
jgi:hypothetical protein